MNPAPQDEFFFEMRVFAFNTVILLSHGLYDTKVQESRGGSRSVLKILILIARKESVENIFVYINLQLSTVCLIFQFFSRTQNIEQKKLVVT